MCPARFQPLACMSMPSDAARGCCAENFGLGRLHLANVILTERPGGRVGVEVLPPNERRELEVYESSILQLTKPRNALPFFMRTADILAEKARSPALLPPAEVRHARSPRALSTVASTPGGCCSR